MFLTRHLASLINCIFTFMKTVNHYTCHSGGAEGADSYFEFFAKKFQVQVIAYSYKTKFHSSENKYELTVDEFKEGVAQVLKANEILKRTKINAYLKLLARNWFQVKYAHEVFAVTNLKMVQNRLQIKGGTAWAVQMAINNGKKVFVYNQQTAQWFYWDTYALHFKTLQQPPKITATHFAGIGTRNINLFGIQAIEELFKNTFE